jgi:cytochrome c oxidase assembly protein subunit 15
MIHPHTSTAHRRIALWLLVCAGLVFAMVVLGGVTRLTRSGLSIVEWQPLMGAIPPLSEADWLALFEKYKLTPEYLKVNVGMDLAGFKGIFWLEYLHRLLGRLIGIAFLLPFLYFLIRRQIDKPLVPKLVALFVLGGLQGLMGWLMVASGLVDMPRVSPYRLTAHLGLALLIYGYILWVALGLLYPRAEAGPELRPLRRRGVALTALIVVTFLAGGFVAGTRAGFVFNDWPWMHGRLIPDGLYAMSPLWVDVFENVATVQFHHRLLAYALVLAVPLFWWRARAAGLPARARGALPWLLAALAAQVLLGILTLVYVVPVPLAALHQAGALVLFTLALYLNHALRSSS